MDGCNNMDSEKEKRKGGESKKKGKCIEFG